VDDKSSRKKNPLQVFLKKFKHASEYKMARDDPNNIFDAGDKEQKQTSFPGGLLRFLWPAAGKVRIRNISPFCR